MFSKIQDTLKYNHISYSFFNGGKRRLNPPQKWGLEDCQTMGGGGKNRGENQEWEGEK